MNLQKIISQHLYHRSPLSYLLYPFSFCYAHVLRCRRSLYRLFPALSYRCPCKIISVGNIMSGGSGKTPFTIFLAHFLTQKGLKVAVSHRGYKGDFENENHMISTRDILLAEASRAGDETYLLAHKLRGIPVVAGKNRRKSLLLLLEYYPDLDYIILDDSFQHLKVKHDFDFILFQAKAGIGNGFVLPAGILREPLSALSDSTAIVWIGNEPVHPKLQSAQKPIINGKISFAYLINALDRCVAPETLKSKKIALLSGIGYPKGFEETVKHLGLKFQHHFRMPDHFDYSTPGCLEEIQAQMVRRKMDIILTTEKDYTKLQDTDLPPEILFVVSIAYTPEDPTIFEKLLL